jgi:dihydrolipoamide dehydrogenase
MSSEEYDLIIIGSGPAGYVCAIRAAQLGLKTACVEYEATLGGTCLNVGCIPSKALLQSSEEYEKILHESEKHGINVGKVTLDLEKMLERKLGVVKGLTGGIEYLFKKNKITWLKGRGSFVDATTIKVTDAKGKESTYKTKKVVVATGSKPVEIPPAKFDRDRIVSSTGALSFPMVPKHLIVVGGGVIGLELGSVWLRLGSKVTVVEAQDRILATMDGDVSKEMTKILKKQGMEFMLDTKLKGTSVTKTQVKAVCEKAGETIEIKGDRMLVAVGRYANTAGLNPEAVGLKLDERGRVSVNEHWQSNIPNIYAIGDVIVGPMLAHKAEDEGVAVAEVIAGKHGHVNYEAIPGVVYTWPEVASVGLSEEECKEKGIKVNIGKFPYAVNGRAQALGTTDGFAKLIADATTDRLLGAHLVGPTASELISELVIAMEFGASAEDIARSCHAHPTLSEVTKEAALGVDRRSLHK